MALPVLKIVIPVEILPWSRNVLVSHVLPEVIQFINRDFVEIADNKVSLWDVVMLIMILGAVIKAVGIFWAYLRFKHYVSLLPNAESETGYAIVRRIMQENDRDGNLVLKWKESGESPEITGFFKSYILIPKGDYTETELECILRHELAHWLHGDMIIRLIWIIIKIICWWNPVIYVLDRQFEALLELRADLNAIKNTKEDVACDYMEMLVHMAQETNSENETAFGAYLLKEKGITPQCRVRLMLAREKRNRVSVWVCNLTAVICMLGLTVAMNVFILEPIGDIPEVENFEGSKMVTGDECFLVKNANGGFDMYMNGIFCVTLEESMDSGLPIYDTLEEALGYEKIE